MDRTVLLFVVLGFLSLACNIECYSRNKFKAAVYEHSLIIPPNRTSVASRYHALADVMVNLKIYDQQAKFAASQDVDILVFPEDGLYGYKFNRKSIKPYLEEIPDPRKEVWNPCTQPRRYADTEIQIYLSCMAMNNSMYIVANMGNKKRCTRRHDPRCPSDGQYQFNTNVVYAPNGRLIARYHKQNLFYEDQFDVPKDVNYATFETPFGKFGTFTCFDILFKEPAITLIEQFNVTNIVFPTAWMDALPLLSSIQFHSAFAEGMGVNFLSANIHLPHKRFHGSGIYTPNGPKNFYYNDVGYGGGKLVISQLDVIRHRKRHQTAYNKVPKPPSNQRSFQAELFKDKFNFVELRSNSGSVSVCHNRLCCHVEYSNYKNNNELYAFGAFDGLHTHEGMYYLQICTLLKCANRTRQSCGKPTKQAFTQFTDLKMYGTFDTNYVYPEVLKSRTRDGQLTLRSTGWRYNNGVLQATRKTSNPVLSASLFGRIYSRDRMPPGYHFSTNSGVITQITVSSLLMVILSVTSVLW
ncbi:hypothetical protein LOTGIDRAFT_218395 [Lottia gigantea]|uniref:CN hydrolase domain-containing protein n=1 Tax=Lottia gigantea TaxID=225164 RepID=V3ZFK9_LOTGI|nr:hypothetical protein LOTGIDRAFT_218395 [Lottia gigantea]ESO89938.1 hypothetical protein LOTGIDRAFT_218395 [Lottia gigantea]